MQFDIYGRSQLHIEREGDAWAVFRLGNGTRVRSRDIFIPCDMAVSEISQFLDDLFHELSGPDDQVKVVG
jgi:hypothetical protein